MKIKNCGATPVIKNHEVRGSSVVLYAKRYPLERRGLSDLAVRNMLFNISQTIIQTIDTKGAKSLLSAPDGEVKSHSLTSPNKKSETLKLPLTLRFELVA